jgi:hypothetical protein
MRQIYQESQVVVLGKDPQVWHPTSQVSGDEVLCIDKETGTDFWQKAIEKEMKAIECVFEFQNKDKMPVGHQHIDCHMVFDVKMTLDCKA